MSVYTISQWIFFFFIYCFCGWCFETTLVSLKEKHFINRGFVRSPFLPIYGFGATIMVIAGSPFVDDPVLMFLCGALSATLMEYVTGWLMELLFKTRYWDYSDCCYQVSGRICAEATLMWGFMTLIVNYKVHIHLEPIILKLSSNLIMIIDIILMVLFISDFIVSAKAAIDVNNILKRMTEIKEEITQLNNRLKDNPTISENHHIESIKNKIKQLQSERSNISNRISFLKMDLINAHPKAKSTKFNNALTELKNKIRDKSNKDK